MKPESVTETFAVAEFALGAAVILVAWAAWNSIMHNQDGE